MKNKFLYSLLLLSACLSFTLLFTACGDDDDDNNTNPVTDGCTLPTGYLKWTVDGGQLCSNASLFGDYAIVMTINGISQSGVTMTMELDSVSPGTYQMTENINHLLFTDQLGMAWESTNDNPGTLVITSNNTSTNLIQGTFNITVRNPLGVSKNITNGNFKISYTE